MSDKEHCALIEGADCFVSLHRAEGFGYHMLEAMALETPVIATAYSGNMDFCKEQTCILVPAKIVNIEHGDYPRANAMQTWADPDFEASISAMKAIYLSEELRRNLVRNARKFVMENFSRATFAHRLNGRLSRLLANSSSEEILRRSSH